ncbi:MAG: hypothetical protein WAW85_13220 [Gordonia sp. (in: high G+C Gram-positive bacteria)]|uniref:hypothetical protein n=1 Tax=Gordonia sp. (in: high G+C Gram-positive bacteria) TaxID=84139 RepID=UPI003BB5961E
MTGSLARGQRPGALRRGGQRTRECPSHHDRHQDRTPTTGIGLATRICGVLILAGTVLAVVRQRPGSVLITGAAIAATLTRRCRNHPATAHVLSIR